MSELTKEMQSYVFESVCNSGDADEPVGAYKKLGCGGAKKSGISKADKSSHNTGNIGKRGVLKHDNLRRANLKHPDLKGTDLRHVDLRCAGGYDAVETANQIRELAAQIEPKVIELRRTLHQNPEIGTEEFETSKFICKKLDELGVEYRKVEGPRPPKANQERDTFIGTGIIATIGGTAPDAYDKTGNPKKRVALRTDMDALPVVEKTGAPYASKNKGKMHACGHDCHMAMMLAAVEMLTQMRDKIHGEVRIIFQPAEEVSLGARDMIAAGAIDGVEAIYGTHIWSEVDAGRVSCQAGPRMASTDWFRIDIEGMSAHGSMPHKGVDAIVVGAEIINSLQVLVSRDVSPFEPVVVTVGEFHGGEARNIMAGSAYLTGTVRTWRKETREQIPDRLERIVGKVAHAFHADVKVEYDAGNPPLINDEHCAEVGQRAIAEVLGADVLTDYEGTLAGEDFSEYLQQIPGVFVFLGARNPEIGAEHPQHSCYYAVDESVLIGGSEAAVQWALDYLAEE